MITLFKLFKRRFMRISQPLNPLKFLFKLASRVRVRLASSLIYIGLLNLSCQDKPKSI